MVRTFGLIPAAGKSRRMGRPKLALPLGDRTVLEAVVTAVRAGGVEVVLVVVGPDGENLATLAERAGATALCLAADTAEMRATIARGLDWIEKQCRPHRDDGWLLVPADSPCVDPDSVRQLLAAKELHPERSIVVPTFGQKRGHPVWIGWQHVPAIRALPPGQGVNAMLRGHPATTLEIAVTSESVLWDLDSPQDYERLKGRFG
jgi:molybdenum cofactor cytidylyltransferase